MQGENTSDIGPKAQREKVSKNVSVSAYQRLGLGLVSDPKFNVSVSISWKVVRSRSRSRLELETKRLGLVSVSDLNVSFTSLHFAADSMCLPSFKYFWWAP